jgi:RNA polymerase sigma-70 factor (ECF subfamily)
VPTPPHPNTSASLLERLRLSPDDSAAWAEFVDRYATVIYDWCRRWNLQDADARDVTQAVLLRLLRGMRSFRYDPDQSFRGWLWTVAHNAWQDFVTTRRKEAVAAGGEFGSDPLAGVATRDDLMARLDGEFDRELLEEAKARVRIRVEPHTWEAFRLAAEEDLPGADVARRLGLPVATVFKAKSKVVKMLQQEIRRLEGQ